MIILGERRRLRRPGEHFLQQARDGAGESCSRPAVRPRCLPAMPPPTRRTTRILFIEDTVPLRRIGSGFVRANDLVRAMASLGCAVTVFPVNGCDHDLARVFGDMPESVEVMYTLVPRSARRLPGRSARLLRYGLGRAAAQSGARCGRSWRDAAAEGTLTARIVLDTEAMTPYREAMRATLAGSLTICKPRCRRSWPTPRSASRLWR